MAEFYGRLQGAASRLMQRFKQGIVTYTITGPDTGPEWAPIPGAPVTYALDATVQGVGDMYRNSTLIRESDLLVTCAVFGAEPVVQGTLSIDGAVMQIVQVKALPAAGTTVAWQVVVRA